MKTCKKLLAIALVAAVLLTTLVSGLVVSAAEPYSVTIADTELTAGEDATVNVTVDFNGDAISALHMLATVETALEIEDAAIVSVDYAEGVTDPGDTELDVPYLRINTDGKNLDAGKILFESGVDGAVKATKVVFALTFKAVAEGTYPIAVSVESTDINEANFAVLTDDANIVAVAPHVCEAGTPVDNGDGTHDVPCTGCDVLIKDNEAHNFVDGVCDVCGAEEPVTGPVVDDSVEQLTHSIAIGETFGVVFKFKASTIDADYASYRLDIKRTYNGGGYNFAYDTTEVTKFNSIPSRDTIQTPTIYGFELYSLTAPIELTWHFFDANGEEVAYSTPIVTSLADVAVAYHDSTESSEAIKKVMADMIQVGAAALNHFTSNKTKNCDYSTLPLPSIESQYITTELGDLTKVSSSEGLSVKIAGALSQSAYFNLTFAGNVANKADYRFVCKYYNAMSKKNIEVEIDGSTMKGNATTIMASLSSFPLFSTNQDVTFELYKVGETDPIAVNHYSMEQYYFDTLETSSNVTLKALITELAEMAQSIRTARKL